MRIHIAPANNTNTLRIPPCREYTGQMSPSSPAPRRWVTNTAVLERGNLQGECSLPDGHEGASRMGRVLFPGSDRNETQEV